MWKVPNNDIFKEPPLYVKARDDSTKKPTPEWSRWFNDVHRELSTKNHQNITAAQAIDVRAKYVSIDSTSGGYAVTLDAPPAPGLRKTIEMTVDGGNVTLALTNCIGGSATTTCTWNDVGDVLILESRSDKWVIFKELGVSLT